MLRFALLACLAALSLGATIPENYSGIQEHIVGGKDTDISEVPYLVSMYKGGLFACGGSIVSPTIIVTAAHCVDEMSPGFISFRAGSSRPYEGGVTVKAKSIISHPSYNPEFMDYDVAIVELAKPLNFSSTIKPIRLITSEPGDGASVNVSGWGLLREKGPLATILQSVIVPMVNRNTCNSYLSKHRKITQRMICAGVEGKDSCQGDSGGPLAYDGQLAGIVSFGIGCARKNLPGVYTNIAEPNITAFIRKYVKN